MLSRALITATVMLLIGGFAAIPLQAENLEAGKSPSQIFAGTCSACHKGTRGLLRTVSPGSLPGFLRQHYTTSSDMAGVLSAYVLSNGATDPRGGGLTRQGQELTGPRPTGTPEQAEGRPGRKPRAGAAAQEAAKPDTDGLTAPGEPGAQRGRNARRLANPEADKPAADGQPGAATANDTGPAGRGSAKQKLSKRGRPGREEPANPDAAKDAAKPEPARDEPGKGEAAKTEPAKAETAPADEAKTEAKPDTKPEASKSETTRTETGKSEGAKPEAGKTEANKGDTPLRPDPVPLVTPAPKPEGGAKPAQTAAPPPQPASPTPTSTASVSPPSGNSAEPTAAPTPATKPSEQASAPPPVPPAGPPAPPISQ
jgi:hypothetical protein